MSADEMENNNKRRGDKNLLKTIKIHRTLVRDDKKWSPTVQQKCFHAPITTRVVPALLAFRISIGDGEGIVKRRSRGVVVSTPDCESCDGTSNLPGTLVINEKKLQDWKLCLRVVCTLLDLRISIGNGEGIARRRSRSVVVSTQGFESCGGGLDLPKTSIKFATLGQYLSKTEVGNKRPMLI
ncbi:unnamed protein product [Enterobius vermicularis]|uniref:Uncharacterized protein n=1 Tax=Enterobius vermicularis TaxID=51028 RepID=A0A0N4V8G8_ENTVE|nr:unnamed protein product [Enterobius vermicularis]